MPDSRRSWYAGVVLFGGLCLLRAFWSITGGGGNDITRVSWLLGLGEHLPAAPAYVPPVTEVYIEPIWLKDDGFVAPSVAFLVLGYEDSPRPQWAHEVDDIMHFAPPPVCPGCPASAQPSQASGPYLQAPEAWWCAQRTYLNALSDILLQYPDKDFYVLADSNTIIFPRQLKRMMHHLHNHVLKPWEDLYMGHGFTLESYADVGLRRFIMSGGSVLLRGLTLRRLAASGMLSECMEEVYNGTWCWHHCDWILAECLRAIGVEPQGHPSFQQHSHYCQEYPAPWHCCHEAAVGCHPVPEDKMKPILYRHEKYFQDNPLHLSEPNWTKPCSPESYEWKWRGWSVVSICREWEYESPTFRNERKPQLPEVFSD